MSAYLDSLVANGQNYDGDTVYDSDGQGYRITGGDTPEMSTINGQNSQQAFSALAQEGGRLAPTGRYDRYGRELTDFVDENDDSIMADMIQGGLAHPTKYSDAEHVFAERRGAFRELLGMPRSDNPTINKYADRRQTDNSILQEVVRGGSTMVRDTRGTAERSWDRGVSDMKLSLGGAINYLGDRFDSDVMREYGREMFNEAAVESDLAAREIESFDEIESLDDAMTYGLETIGEALPGFGLDAGMAIATGGGSLLATAARRTGTAALTRATAMGAAASAGVQSGGAMEAQLEMQGSEDNPFAPLAAGGVSAAATALPVGIVLDRVLGNLGDDKIKRAVSERVIKGFASAGAGAAVELPTSAAESMGNQIIENISLGKDRELDYDMIVDEALRGALGGAIFGGTADATTQGMDAAYHWAAERAKTDLDGNELDENNNIIDPETGEPMAQPVQENGPVVGEVYKDRAQADRTVGLGALAPLSNKDLDDLSASEFAAVNKLLTGSESITQRGDKMRSPRQIEADLMRQKMGAASRQQAQQEPDAFDDIFGMSQSNIGDGGDFDASALPNVTEDMIVRFLADYRNDDEFSMDSKFNYRRQHDLLNSEIMPEFMDAYGKEISSEDRKGLDEELQELNKLYEDEDENGAVTSEYREQSAKVFGLIKKLSKGKDYMSEADRRKRSTDIDWRRPVEYTWRERMQGEVSQKGYAAGEQSDFNRFLTGADSGEAINAEQMRLQQTAEEAEQRLTQEFGKNALTIPMKQLGELAQQGSERADAILKTRQLIDDSKRQIEDIDKQANAGETDLNILDAVRVAAKEHEETTNESMRDVNKALDMAEAIPRLVENHAQAQKKIMAAVTKGGADAKDFADAERHKTLFENLVKFWGTSDPKEMMVKSRQFIEDRVRESGLSLDDVVQGYTEQREFDDDNSLNEDAGTSPTNSDEMTDPDSSSINLGAEDGMNTSTGYRERAAADLGALEQLVGLGLEDNAELRNRLLDPRADEAEAGGVRDDLINPSMEGDLLTTDREASQMDERQMSGSSRKVKTSDGIEFDNKTFSTKKGIRYVNPDIIASVNTKISEGDTTAAVNLLQNSGLISRPGTKRQAQVSSVIRNSSRKLGQYRSARKEINDEAQQRADWVKENKGEERTPFVDNRSDAGVKMDVPVVQGNEVSTQTRELDGWEITKLGAKAEGIDLENTRWEQDDTGSYLKQVEQAFLTGLQMIAGEGINHNGVDHYGSFDTNVFTADAVIGRVEGLDVVTWGDVMRGKYNQSRSESRQRRQKPRIFDTSKRNSKYKQTVEGEKRPGKSHANPPMAKEPMRLFTAAWTAAKEDGKKPIDLHHEDWARIKGLARRANRLREQHGIEMFDVRLADAPTTMEKGRIVSQAQDKERRVRSEVSQAYEYLQNNEDMFDGTDDVYLSDVIADDNTNGELYRGEESLEAEANTQEDDGFEHDQRYRMTKKRGEPKNTEPKEARQVNAGFDGDSTAKRPEQKDAVSIEHEAAMNRVARLTDKVHQLSQRIADHDGADKKQLADLEREHSYAKMALADARDDKARLDSQRKQSGEKIKVRLNSTKSALKGIQERIARLQGGETEAQQPTQRYAATEQEQNAGLGQAPKRPSKMPAQDKQARIADLQRQAEQLSEQVQVLEQQAKVSAAIDELIANPSDTQSGGDQLRDTEAQIKVLNDTIAELEKSKERKLSGTDYTPPVAKPDGVDLSVDQKPMQWPKNEVVPSMKRLASRLSQARKALGKAKTDKQRQSAQSRIDKWQGEIDKREENKLDIGEPTFTVQSALRAIENAMAGEQSTPADTRNYTGEPGPGTAKGPYRPDPPKAQSPTKGKVVESSHEEIPRDMSTSVESDEQEVADGAIQAKESETNRKQRIDTQIETLEAKRDELERKRAAIESGEVINEDGSNRPVDADKTDADPELGTPEPESQADRIKREKAIVKAFNKKGNSRGNVFKDFFMTLMHRVNKIHPEMGAKLQGYLTEREMQVQRRVVKLNRLFKDAKKLQRAYTALAEGRDTESARELKKYIDEMESYIVSKNPNYEPTGKPPTVVNYSKLVNNREGFMQILAEAKVPNPEQFADELIESRGVSDFNYAPTGNPTRRKNDELAPALEKLTEGGFIVTDAPTLLTRYTYSAVNMAEWSDAFGGYNEDGRFIMNGQMDEYMKEVHPAKREEAVKLLKGATGRLHLHHNKFIRTMNAAGMAFQTATVLLFSAVASIPELGVMYSRARELNGAGSDIKKAFTSQGRKEMYKFAADYGIAVDETIKHTLSSLYGMDELTSGRISEKVAETVFKYNGQEKLTHFNRVLAAEIGKRTMYDHATKARNGNRRSQRMLAELNIDAETILMHRMNPSPDTPAGDEFANALGRFVNQSVTNPHAGQLPLIASDPRFILLTSLKKFFYGFFDNVHNSLYKEYKARRAEGSSYRTALAPAVMTAALLMPLAGIAEMLRELIKDPMNDKEDDLATWMRRSALATGGLGPFQAAQSAYDATGYGRNFLVSLAGPSADFVINDFITGEVFTKRPARLLPVVNQLPYARNPLNDSWRDLIGSSDY